MCAAVGFPGLLSGPKHLPQSGPFLWNQTKPALALTIPDTCPMSPIRYGWLPNFRLLESWGELIKCRFQGIGDVVWW
jgi:hypothetical protein